MIVVSSAGQAQEVFRQLSWGMDFRCSGKGEIIDPSANDGGYIGQSQPSQIRPEVRVGVRKE